MTGSMCETMVCGGMEFIYRPHTGKWIAVWGPGNENCYHLRQVGAKWFARHPRALEDVCSASTLSHCASLTVQHHKKLQQDRADWLARRIG